MLLLAFSAYADEPGYELVRPPPPPVKAGKRASLSLTLLPHAGHRLLNDAPVEVRLSAEGATLPKPLLHRDDAVDPRAEAPRFEVPVDTRTPGHLAVRAHCTFYLCRDARCRPVETDTEWSLDVLP